jgi:hypothetical protein
LFLLQLLCSYVVGSKGCIFPSILLPFGFQGKFVPSSIFLSFILFFLSFWPAFRFAHYLSRLFFSFLFYPWINNFTSFIHPGCVSVMDLPPLLNCLFRTAGTDRADEFVKLAIRSDAMKSHPLSTALPTKTTKQGQTDTLKVSSLLLRPDWLHPTRTPCNSVDTTRPQSGLDKYRHSWMVSYCKR